MIGWHILCISFIGNYILMHDNLGINTNVSSFTIKPRQFGHLVTLSRDICVYIYIVCRYVSIIKGGKKKEKKEAIYQRITRL